MRKQILILLVALMAFTQSTFAYDFSAQAPSGHTLYYNIVDGHAEVTWQTSSYPRYTDLSGDLIIPESVDFEGITYSVTRIGDNAFYGCAGMTSVTIPNSVTNIEPYAFYFCAGLTSVTIPNSVTTMRAYAFSHCTGLTSVTIGNSVTIIGSYAFEYCTNLTSVNIGSSVTSIGIFAFYQCTSLPSVTIPDPVTTIESYAFYMCTGLTSVTLPSTLTSLERSAFEKCSSLTSIVCLAEMPPAVDIGVFYNVPSDIPVYVPCGRVADYQESHRWCCLTNIQEVIGCTHVYAEGNDIVVDGAAGNTVTLMDESGNALNNGTAPLRFEGLSNGTYYVKIGVLPARMKVEVR